MPDPSCLRSRKKAKRKANRQRILAKRPFNCSLCKYSTNIQDRMLKHIVRTHSRVKPFSCHLCSFKSGDRDDLKKHLSVHMGRDPYQCNQCDFITTQATILDHHLKLHRTLDDPYGCDQCNFKTSQQSILLDHLKTHTDTKLSCYLCDNRDATLRTFKEQSKGCRLCQLHTCACCNLTTIHLCVKCVNDCMVRWTYRRTTIHISNDSESFYNYVGNVLTCALCKRTFKAKIGYFSHMQWHLRNNKCALPWITVLSDLSFRCRT